MYIYISKLKHIHVLMHFSEIYYEIMSYFFIALLYSEMPKLEPKRRQFLVISVFMRPKTLFAVSNLGTNDNRNGFSGLIINTPDL